MGIHSKTIVHTANECIRLLIGAISWKKEENVNQTLTSYAVQMVDNATNESKLLLTLDFVIVVSIQF